jgi:hypothetical protein
MSSSQHDTFARPYEYQSSYFTRYIFFSSTLSTSHIMYDSWYLDQYDQYNDLFHEYFDIFGLKSQGSDTRLGQPERLNAKNILEWVESSTHNQVSTGHVNMRLLYVSKCQFWRSLY